MLWAVIISRFAALSPIPALPFPTLMSVSFVIGHARFSNKGEKVTNKNRNVVKFEGATGRHICMRRHQCWNS